MNLRITKKTSGFSTIELLIVVVVIVILGSLILVTYKGVQQRNRDTERKSDIIKLEGQIETYQAETNKYPSVAQVNKPAFRAANLKGLENDSLSDPSWKPANTTCTLNGSPQLEDSSTPATGCYGYHPSPAGCDNTNIDCTSYILTANLETGGIYAKQSIN